MERAGECVCDEVCGVEARCSHHAYAREAAYWKLYSIVIIGGGKYTQVWINFHNDNFAIVDNIMDVLALLLALDHILTYAPSQNVMSCVASAQMCLHLPQLNLQCLYTKVAARTSALFTPRTSAKIIIFTRSCRNC